MRGIVEAERRKDRWIWREVRVAVTGEEDGARMVVYDQAVLLVAPVHCDRFGSVRSLTSHSVLSCV